MLPGSAEWLLARIDAHVALMLRKELRRIQRDLDAVFAGLWLTTTRGDVLVEFAGEVAFAPPNCPLVQATVPIFEEYVSADGLQHEAVVHRPRLGRGMPRLALLIADPRGHGNPVVFDAVEASGERVEEILVAAIAA